MSINNEDFLMTIPKELHGHHNNKDENICNLEE
jgi:gentisate 1,2-dioxygenase